MSLSEKGRIRLLRNFLRNARDLQLTSAATPAADGLFSEINPVYLKKPGLNPALMGMGHTGFVIGFVSTAFLVPLTVALLFNSTVRADPIAAIGVVLMLLAAALFSYSWISGLCKGRAPAPTYFNRRTGRVYFSYHGEPRTVPFDELTPMVNTGRVVGPGLASFRNLALVQFKPGAEKTEENALCSIGISGMQNTSEVCQAQWEFIRKYMNGASPEQLPEIKLLQDKPDWVMWMADVVDWLSMVTGVVTWVGHINEVLLLFIYPQQALPAEAASACVYDPQRDGENQFKRQSPQDDPMRKIGAAFTAVIVASYTAAGIWLYAKGVPYFVRGIIDFATSKT